jgi:serine protease
VADSYAFYQGTSMATPHVAGVAALMFARKSTLTPDQIELKLKSTARPFPATCTSCGSGIVDANAAADAAIIDDDVTKPETESNNTTGTANPVTTSGTTMSGNMSSSSDNDYFVVQLPAGKTLTAVMTPGSATADYDLYMYNSNGTQIDSSENGAGATDTVSMTNTGASTFARYVRVKYYSGGTGSTNGKYTVKFTW